jgi:hypothetical protein
MFWRCLRGALLPFGMKVVSQTLQVADIAKRELRAVLRLVPLLLNSIGDWAPHRGLQSLVLELLQ